MLLFVGIIVVDSRNPRSIKLVDFRFDSKPYVDWDTYNSMCGKIKSIFNPQGISFDEAVLWMLNNKPYGKNQTSAKIVRVLSPSHLLTEYEKVDVDVGTEE